MNNGHDGGPQVDVSHDTYRVAWLTPSQVEALQGLEAVLADVVVDMQEDGEDVPEPISERSYPGKFNLRLGEKLHREVALRAAAET